ncbi:MAG: hypothetical protein LBJ93_03060 [Clostridiales bacterium]|jgi:hypothetical protein|nr:hypothetical protein [Clostridiales bacterium]
MQSTQLSATPNFFEKFSLVIDEPTGIRIPNFRFRELFVRNFGKNKLILKNNSRGIQIAELTEQGKQEATNLGIQEDELEDFTYFFSNNISNIPLMGCETEDQKQKFKEVYFQMFGIQKEQTGPKLVSLRSKAAILKNIYFEFISLLDKNEQQKILGLHLQAKQNQTLSDEERFKEYIVNGHNIKLDHRSRRIIEINGEPVVDSSTKQLLGNNGSSERRVAVDRHKILFDEIITPSLQQQYLIKKDKEFNEFIALIESFLPAHQMLDLTQLKYDWEIVKANLFLDTQSKELIDAIVRIKEQLISCYGFIKNNLEITDTGNEYLFFPIFFGAKNPVEAMNNVKNEVELSFIENYFQQAEESRSVLSRQVYKVELQSFLIEKENKFELKEDPQNPTNPEDKTTATLEVMKKINKYFKRMTAEGFLSNQKEINFYLKLAKFFFDNSKLIGELESKVCLNFLKNLKMLVPTPSETSLSETYCNNFFKLKQIFDNIFEYNNRLSIEGTLYRSMGLLPEQQEGVITSGSIVRPDIRNSLFLFNSKVVSITLGTNVHDGIVTPATINAADATFFLIQTAGNGDQCIAVFQSDSVGFATGSRGRLEADANEVNLPDTKPEDMAFIINLDTIKLIANPHFAGTIYFDGRKVETFIQLQEILSAQCSAPDIVLRMKLVTRFLSKIKIVRFKQILREHLIIKQLERSIPQTDFLSNELISEKVQLLTIMHHLKNHTLDPQTCQRIMTTENISTLELISMLERKISQIEQTLNDKSEELKGVR